jgi:hypothetical protein
MSGVFLFGSHLPKLKTTKPLVLNTCFEEDQLQRPIATELFGNSVYEKSPVVNIECFWIFLVGGFLQSREETHELYNSIGYLPT